MRVPRDTLELCFSAEHRIGLEALTLYAFSVENWKRPRAEVSTLMGLLKQYLRKELDTLLRNHILFGVIGRPEALPADVREELQRAIERTRDEPGLRFSLALNYGGRTEITDAVKRLIADLQLQGRSVEAVDEALLSSYLYTSDLPDPDLLIRTSGELRVSNFLLWQIAYSELWVTDVLWPDFRRGDLFAAIAEFQNRSRRFGASE